MRRSVLATVLLLVACTREAPPPPPPPPAAHPAATTSATATVTPTPAAPATTAAPPPTTTVMIPATTAVPPTTATAPPTTVLPGGHVPSAICQRAAHCCGTAASRAPRGIPRRGHSPRELLMARDAQCAQAIGMCAEAFMEFGERPPDYCRQPGRHAESREW